LLRLESPVVLAVAAAVLCIEEGRRRGVLLSVAWLAMGFGVMTKGVVGLLPVAIYLVAMPFLRQTHPFNRRSFWFGIPVFAAVVAPWYVYMIATEPNFLAVHVGEQQTGRLISPWSLSHLLAFLYGNPYQFLRYHWPWLPFLICGAILAVRLARRGNLEGRPRDRYEARLLLLWTGTLYAVLLVLRDPFHRYALPAYPALALLAALPIDRTLGPALAKLWRRRAEARFGPLEVFGPRLALGFVIVLSVTLFSLPVSFTSIRYPEVRAMAAWHREHPSATIAALPGAPLGYIAPLFHVDAGIRISTLHPTDIDGLRARVPIAIVHQNEMPLPPVLASAGSRRVVIGRRFDLYLLPSLSELPKPPASR
jgi:4-amino-4-deoxy-L-arabinose transferase-like glycosyltransferase